MIGDLHTHTVLSDSSCTSKRIFELARNSGIDYIAITDHDYIPSFDEYEENRKLASDFGINLIHGVEISSRDLKRNRRVHILCYFPENIKPIEKICNQTTQRRYIAGIQMSEMVSKEFPITVEDIKETSKTSASVFKQHIMKTLMQAGYCTEIFGELYSELFSSNHGKYLINVKSPDVYEVISAVRESKGICVMAHPYTYESINLLDELIHKNLLDGIEVWSSKSNQEQEKYLSDIADKYHLIKTGGSDFHGAFGSRKSPIGCKTTPKESIERIFELKNKQEELCAKNAEIK